MQHKTTISDAQLEQLTRSVGAELINQGWMLTTAESLTGGWIAKACTDIPGSSGWFDRAFVTYSILSKQEMLGIDPALIEREGVISTAVAAAMANAALERSRADCSLAVTGLAGPGGGCQTTPVGAVCCAWAARFSPARDTPPRVRRWLFEGSREQIRRQTVWHALQGLRHGILAQPRISETEPVAECRPLT